jgi:AraC-like DNA-binding protein
MARIEPISPGCSTCARTTDGPLAFRTRHRRGESLDRHRHSHAFLAIVLSGSYVEAGDTGRHLVGPGDVIVHETHEAHLDRFDAGPAEVLVLPRFDGRPIPTVARIEDVDAVARLADGCPADAYDLACSQLISRTQSTGDWPDVLAADLVRDPLLSLDAWANAHGLHRGSLGRGFRQVFGVTPTRYRAEAKARRATLYVGHTSSRLCDVAADNGFSDQAHLTRAFREVTGQTPAFYRRHSRVRLGS